RRLGVDLHPRAVSASGNTVNFGDGTQLAVDAVVWATGYQPDYSWIEAPVLDAGGRVRHQRGVTDLPGLYFLGLYWQHTRGSALLGWVKDDAEYIATQIQSRAGSRFPTDTRDLPESQPSKVVSLANEEEFDLRIAPMVKRLGDTTVRMLAYNGSVPGPTMRV